MQDLLMMAHWSGEMSDSMARTLIAAGVALLFAAILQLRGPYSEFLAKRSLSIDLDQTWAPCGADILAKIDELAPGWSTSVKITAGTCTRMCTFLKTQWSSIFEKEDQPTTVESAMALVNNCLMHELQFSTESKLCPWSRTPNPSMIQTLTDFGMDSSTVPLIDLKYVPLGLGSKTGNHFDDAQLCLELATAGKRLISATRGAPDELFAKSRHYAALVQFHRCGFDPKNMEEARSHCMSGVNDEPVDLGNPDAFWVLEVNHKVPADDFRSVAQRVRQHEFVRQYLRIVAQTDSLCEDEGDDVTVMMNMAARLDRMWRRDFKKHRINSQADKINICDRWHRQFGTDTTLESMFRIMVLGENGGLSRERALRTLRNANDSAQYMNIKYQWPSACTPELRLLRHEVNLFTYNREALPHDMERLAVDIVTIEACCVQVFATIDAIIDTEEAQRTWAIVCLAMFTIFDLRPIFMSIH
jgi:hypothetical protein